MSRLNAFFKQNRKNEDKEIKVVLSEDFLDENGEAMEWILRPCKSRRSRKLLEQATQINSKGETVFMQAEYMHKLAVASVVFPDLENAELQDSYGVMSAEDLLDELLSDVQSYSKLLKAVNDVNSKKSVDELTEEAKN